MASIFNEPEANNEEEDVPEALDVIAALFIHIGIHNEEDSANEGHAEQSFSHLATLDDINMSAAFTADLQCIVYVHAMTSPVPKMRF